MDPKLQTALVSIGVAIATALVQQFAIVSPTEQRADANREANFTARDQLRVCLQALSEEIGDGE